MHDSELSKDLSVSLSVWREWIEINLSTNPSMTFSLSLFGESGLKSIHSTSQRFTEFTMVVDEEKFENSFDGFAAMGLAISGLYYQIFNGVKEDKVEATIIKDKISGETIDTIVSPDDLNQ